MSIFLPAEQTRLVTIAAHVDHGKTSLADSLIESNGLISERQAGTLRYLDSDPEEQRRGITMRASAIGLQHAYKAPKQDAVKMIVHLLDSPGHTDFSMEVSSALLACDGCILVIDAVEGMGARTHQVLREAYLHQLVPVLVINKLDRYFTELQLSPTEAYVRLRGLLETVNAASAAMITSASQDYGKESENQASLQDEEKELEAMEARWTFDPASGNVIFGSALFGWGWTVPALCRSLFRSKGVSIRPPLLKQYLFGDYKLKGDKVLKWKMGQDEEPLFAQYALQPMHDIYKSVAEAVGADGQLNLHGLDPALEAMKVGATPSNATGQAPVTDRTALQALLSRTGASSADAILRAITRRYRPLSDAVLDAVCEVCPSPVQAASEVRSRALALQLPTQPSPAWTSLQTAVSSCDASDGAPLVAHVGKFMSTERMHIRDPEMSSDESHVILGVARVLSGQLQTGKDYYVMGPKHASGTVGQQRTVRLYLLMGSSFVRVEKVPAGHLCAVYGLENVQLKTITLCGEPEGTPLAGFEQWVRPLVKVNVEPEDAADTDALERGLIKLSLADGGVEVTATAKGERLLACLGELHLEQSILDLEKVYCGKPIKLRVSDPIVDFGETTDWFEGEMDYVSFFTSQEPPLRQSQVPPYNEEEGLIYAHRGRTRSILSGRSAALGLRVLPCLPVVHKSLQAGAVIDGAEDELIKIGRALGWNSVIVGDSDMTAQSVLTLLLESQCSLGTNGTVLVESPRVQDGSFVKGVDSEKGEVYMVPKRGKQEVQEEYETEATGKQVYEELRQKMLTGQQDDAAAASSTDEMARTLWTRELRRSAVAGFQLAVRSGPICEEPVRNVLILLESVEIAVSQKTDGSFHASKPLDGGMVVSSLRSGVRSALLTRPARLMEGHLRLTLHSSLSGLGPLYSVLSKRRGKVVEDTMVDGTDLLMITASIPQAESFGLAPELSKKTSGEVTAPELVFSHWERLEVDPFWIPTTEDEREDFGELLTAGDASTGIDNTALKYIRTVRKRKGLLVDSVRTVMGAEKQRTLKR